MEHKTLLSTLIAIMVIFVLVYVFPWRMINWGTISMQPSEIITVSGYADSQKGNQQATFSAGVTAVNNEKQPAVDEVNTKIDEIITKVKEFGIPESDVKTANLSIYQNQDSYVEDGVTRMRPGQWSVSNNVEITLKDVTKADDLANLLASTGANNVWGPNFTTGDSRDAQKELLSAAIDDAKSKAEEAARAAGKKLGRVLSVTEGGAGGSYPYPMYDQAMGMGGGGGIGLQPGTTTVSQSVVVTFELR